MKFKKILYQMLFVLLILTISIGTVSAASTTSVEISRIAADGTTILANETVTYEWMKENLPITGDGTTHYGHQGPVFEAASGYYGDPWDPQEIINTDDAGVLRGTSILDLAGLVGGLPENSTVKIIATDGFSRTFSSSYLISPDSSMGPLVLVWEVNGVNVSSAGSSGDASDGMRVYFFADDGVFGNYDMFQTMPESDWYNYSTVYPSTRGLSVRSVDRIKIYTEETAYNPTPTVALSSLNLIEGWNFISVPKALSSGNDTAVNLFGTVDTANNAILVYNTTKNQWETVEPSQIIKPLEAYWIYSTSPVSLPLVYASPSASPSIKILYPGWNTVGLASAVNISAQTAFSGTSWKTLIPWILELGRYDTAVVNGGSDACSPERTLMLGNGYWVYVESESILTELT